MVLVGSLGCSIKEKQLLLVLTLRKGGKDQHVKTGDRCVEETQWFAEKFRTFPNPCANTGAQRAHRRAVRTAHTIEKLGVQWVNAAVVERESK